MPLLLPANATTTTTTTFGSCLTIHLFCEILQVWTSPQNRTYKQEIPAPVLYRPDSKIVAEPAMLKHHRMPTKHQRKMYVDRNPRKLHEYVDQVNINYFQPETLNRTFRLLLIFVVGYTEFMCTSFTFLKWLRTNFANHQNYKIHWLHNCHDHHQSISTSKTIHYTQCQSAVKFKHF